jgi:expansin
MKPASLCLLLALGCAAPPGPAAVPLGEQQQGVATYYDADGSGNCSFDPSPSDLMIAAMNDAEYQGSAVCGACAEVNGPQGNVRVRIVDRCPECQKGHLDLSQQAFERIAPLVDGRVPIQWRLVSCEVSGPLSYRFKEGSSQWWTAVQVRNHRLPVVSVELGREGAWTPLKRESYNYFVAEQGAGPGKFRLRTHSSGGTVVEDELLQVGDGQTVSGSGQL